ncbi:MAG: M48 family metallopeptidase [Candidatus Krumholzibacteria bacterium]|nr:M48 family metallopeptidase [Candidatus Krumholzibacteria bacterium]MDH4337417.1 M48 family metallopeptidase [Candidatus Krumholzibacteria bacterium]MDH5270910.1 M48 family metallopeptidase [Candidatus Krumholzibacteria bacterium]
MVRFAWIRSMLAVCAATMLVAACSTVPLTGRKQLNIIPDSEMLSMSYQQYDQFLTENKKSTDAGKTAMIQRVGKRIQAAVEQYARDTNNSKQLDGYQWEFNLVESDEVNAWCMPGGKVVFYTGILPVCQDENGIAVVMGHEVAHAVAKHGSERMSQGLLAQMGGVALSEALKSEPEQTQALAMTAFGVGAQYGALLPFSRKQESEADHLGLVFMAMAGYDPHVAVPFWERMAAGGGGKPPEFMSTHPSDQTRINNLNSLMPEAMKYYKPVP